MGSILRAAVIGIVGFFGISIWAQTAGNQQPATSVAYSSSLDHSSRELVAPAPADFIVASASSNLDALHSPAFAHSNDMEPMLIAAPAKPQKQDSEKVFQGAKKKAWFSLAAVEHSAAGFDAWSTRQGIGSNVTESNPLLKPFANSPAMYAATQVVPTGMDILARYMMRSNNHVVRKLWWLPQTASTVASLASGFHNLQY